LARIYRPSIMQQGLGGMAVRTIVDHGTGLSRALRGVDREVIRVECRPAMRIRVGVFKGL